MSQNESRQALNARDKIDAAKRTAGKVETEANGHLIMGVGFIILLIGGGLTLYQSIVYIAATHDYIVRMVETYGAISSIFLLAAAVVFAFHKIKEALRTELERPMSKDTKMQASNRLAQEKSIAVHSISVQSPKQDVQENTVEDDAKTCGMMEDEQEVAGSIDTAAPK